MCECGTAGSREGRGSESFKRERESVAGNTPTRLGYALIEVGQAEWWMDKPFVPDSLVHGRTLLPGHVPFQKASAGKTSLSFTSIAVCPLQ